MGKYCINAALLVNKLQFGSKQPEITAMENGGEIEIADVEIEADDIETEVAEDEPMIKKLKREMQCHVCDQSSISIPIPACPMGHIVCTECKDKIPFSRQL